MKIVGVESWRERVPLTRPYAIATGTTEHADLLLVRVVAEGASGLGCAAPVAEITGETVEACAAALAEDRLAGLAGRDARALPSLCGLAAELLEGAPAARAAVDMALHDLAARARDVPLVDLLGVRGPPLPTSVTIGIQPLPSAVEEVREHLGRGFRCLKVKVGGAIDEDLERLHAIRGCAGPDVRIRVDANGGYTFDEAARLAGFIEPLGLELVEQPLPASDDEDLERLPAGLRRVLGLDESVHDVADVLAGAARPGPGPTYVVKLMKCGGVTPAREVARAAERLGCGVMWGCMDESVISIAAALHAAYSSPATRYLDLDGSFDLARDPAEGGFRLVDGTLHLLNRPGLGVRLRE